MASAFLLNQSSVVFDTRDYALVHAISYSSASHVLARLDKKGLLARVTRGVWVNLHHPFYSPFCTIHKLLAEEQGYISFLLALHLHGLISQIPGSIQVATTGRARKLKTSVGIYEFFQIKPELMQVGIVWSNSKVPYRIATPEKALFDTLYVSTRRGRRFASLPEFDFDSGNLSKEKFDKLLADSKIPLSLKTAIKQRALGIFSNL